MSLPTPNMWTAFLALGEVINLQDLYETRMDNDVNGKILYIGYSQIQNAATDIPVWYLLACEYDVNGYMNRKRLPDDGAGFLYIWDNRTTYFA